VSNHVCVEGVWKALLEDGMHIGIVEEFLEEQFGSWL
jgi:hypothetical protein